MQKNTGNGEQLSAKVGIKRSRLYEILDSLKNGLGIHIRFNRNTGHFEYEDETAYREIINAFVLINSSHQKHCLNNDLI